MVGYIINLEHRVDRLAEITTELPKLPNVNFNIVRAVYDDVGWRGCFLSHKKCIADALQQGYESVLIIEDDTLFADNAATVLEKSYSEATGRGWDMFYLGANITSPITRLTSNLIKLNSAHAAHAYIINSSLYDVVLSYEINKPIDVYYHDLMKERTVLMCDPMIAIQRPSYSDIEVGFRDYTDLLLTRYRTNIR